MPIYAYRCAACGHAKDALQKVSDPLLTVCPACGADTFQKQVTAAGFQLKGSGWYVTDFRDGAKSAPSADKPAGDAKPADAGTPGKADASNATGSTGKSEAAGAKPSAPAAAPASTPSTSTGGPAPAPSSSSS